MFNRHRQNLLGEFLDEIKDLNYLEMTKHVGFKTTELKTKVIELKSDGMTDEFRTQMYFYAQVKYLDRFLKTLKKPDELNQRQFNRYRWIAEKLVLNEQIDSKVLELFDPV